MSSPTTDDEAMLPSDDPTAIAVTALRQSVLGAAGEAPETLAALVKDVGVLVKLLRNPAEQPDEAKFRKIKLSNAAIARVLANAGVSEVLHACGFVGGEEELALHKVDASRLLRGVAAVEAVHLALQELHWLHAIRASEPTLCAQPWAVDVERCSSSAAQAIANACLAALHTPGPELPERFSERSKAAWVQRLCHILCAAEMRESRQVVLSRGSVAVAALRRAVRREAATTPHPRSCHRDSTLLRSHTPHRCSRRCIPGRCRTSPRSSPPTGASPPSGLRETRRRWRAGWSFARRACRRGGR